MTTTLVAQAPHPPTPPGRPPSRLLLACGMLAGPLFVIAFLLQDAFREGYDPMREPVSSLALGPWGWVQIANFVVAGLLTVACAVGLRRATGTWAVPLLVGVWGVGLVGAGAFITDPVPAPAEPTWHGFVHDYVFSLPAFFCMAAAMFVSAVSAARRRAPLWSVYSGLSGAAFLALFFVFGAGFGQEPGLVGTAGLWQRLCVGVGWLWLALLARRAYKTS